MSFINFEKIKNWTTLIWGALKGCKICTNSRIFLQHLETTFALGKQSENIILSFLDHVKGAVSRDYNLFLFWPNSPK